MELLRFDSNSPAKRFIPLINQLKASVANAGTIHRSRSRFWDSAECIAPAANGIRLLAEL
jgi:hypothetical protein